MTEAGGSSSGVIQQPRPHVRPWALAAPIVILLVPLPLLRPLRHPVDISRQESRVLTSGQAGVERGQKRIETPAELKGVEGMPVFSLLLCGPYWVMRKMGLELGSNPLIV